jgi:4-hydroxybenzoate polyprenyltransferase
MICSLFFARLFNVSTSAYTIAALGFSVWAIYTIDHLKDARAICGPASTDRHRFHQLHFGLLSSIVFVVVLSGIALTWFIPERISSFGFALGAVVSIYLVIHRHARFLKEFFVAGLYTCGVLLPVFVVPHLSLRLVDYIIIVEFFLTALMNLLVFSLFDFERDEKHGQQSFATRFGRSVSRKCIFILGAVNVSTGVWLISSNHAVAIILMLMNVILLIVVLNERYFQRNNYYRIAGDGIFLLPLLYFI